MLGDCVVGARVAKDLNLKPAAGKHADQADGTTDAGSIQGFFQGPAAAGFDGDVDTHSVGQFQHPRLPVRGFTIIDQRIGAELRRTDKPVALAVNKLDEYTLASPVAAGSAS